MKQDREVSGEFIPATDKDELCEELEQGTLELANAGKLPLFTASEIANSYSEGQYSTRTIKRRLSELKEEGKVTNTKIRRHSDRPMIVWFSPAIDFNINTEDFTHNPGT